MFPVLQKTNFTGNAFHFDISTTAMAVITLLRSCLTTPSSVVSAAGPDRVVKCADMVSCDGVDLDGAGGGDYVP